MSQARNRRIVLASRPKGAPVPDNFRLEEEPLPEPADGQFRLRNLYLSLDPYMRGRMSDAASYAAPNPLDDVMGGATVARVEASRNADFQDGALVLAFGGWQDYALSDGRGVMALDPELAHPSHALSLLGMPGFTAWHGLLKIGAPKAGETVVVAAATGAVGSVVGQIARIRGARAVGIAGGRDKCRFAVEELGFDACVDHRSPDFPAALEQATQEGIDVYFENVGGAVFDAVFPRLNDHARIPLCGLIANYNRTAEPSGPDRLAPVMAGLLVKRILVQGFIIADHYGPDHEEFLRDMTGWLREGRMTIREDIVDGLENAPEAFIGLLEGRNFGKLVIRINA